MNIYAGDKGFRIKIEKLNEGSFSFADYLTTNDNFFLELIDKDGNILKKWSLNTASGYGVLFPVKKSNGAWITSTDSITNYAELKLNSSDIGVYTGKTAWKLIPKLSDSNFDDGYYNGLYCITEIYILSCLPS